MSVMETLLTWGASVNAADREAGTSCESMKPAFLGLNYSQSSLGCAKDPNIKKKIHIAIADYIMSRATVALVFSSERVHVADLFGGRKASLF